MRTKATSNPQTLPHNEDITLECSTFCVGEGEGFAVVLPINFSLVFLKK